MENNGIPPPSRIEINIYKIAKKQRIAKTNISSVPLSNLKNTRTIPVAVTNEPIQDYSLFFPVLQLQFVLFLP